MNPELWQQVKQILSEIRELPPEARAAHLDETCDGDPELRREIETLLAAHQDALAFLDRPPITLLGQREAAVDETSQVGVYRILRRLGSGGMGIVYLATKVGDESEREMALKVLQLGSVDREAEQRFLQEMKILAKLNHPNIARLQEGGRTDDGRLYYLMEYVEGQAIDDYCRDHELALEERLRLFQRVAAAVQYAHTKLVIHRDIKPSNVLVTAAGEPKLLDFGVAKPLDGAGMDATVVTGASQRLFTPDYASPEQISGDDIHIASDVYSLGILLYELLAGDRPYRLKALAQQEIRRRVCDETPPPPSAALGRTRDAGAGPEPPDTDPTTASFRKRLQGDLDTIVLMALRKEPGQRYSTVQELADDIDRHLAGRPIEARAPSIGYRARKFLKRNRLGLGIAGLFLALVLVATLALVKQYRETVRERDRAQQVTDFMVEVFDAADPDTGGADGPTAQQLLQAAQERVLSEFEDNPRLKADLLVPIVYSYGGLGLHREASDLGKQLVDLLSEVYGPSHPRTAEAMTRTAISEVYAGDFDEAVEHLEAALATWLARGSEETLELASTLDYLGIAQRRGGQLKAAEVTQRRALAIRRRLLGPSDPEVSASLNNLATVLQVQGRYEEAIPLANEALEIDRATVGDSHPSYFAALIGVGILDRKSGNLEAAERHFSEALELGDRLYPEGHPHLATALNNYALLKAQQFDVVGAEALYRRSLAMDRKILGPGNPSTAIAITNLAILLQTQGRLQEARGLYETAIADLEEAHGSDNPYVLEAQAKYGDFLWNIGEREEGVKLMERAIEGKRKHYDPDSPVIATGLHNLAFLRQMQGRLVEAESLCREALQIDKQSYQEGHRQIVRDQHRLASILEGLDRHDECAEISRAALDGLRRHLPADHWRIADARSVLGGCLAGLDRLEEARPLLEESYLFLKEDRGDDAWQTQGARARLDAL